ncbi:MAG: hypothetical protein CSB55_02150 [Candidatus Cloacimonadota bacterium]|nr:MAG: hypothetical protein CSB55_02150 [Candidatus Cloacimonadota bacterium]
MKAGILTAGNEILLGKTLNGNLGFIGQFLAENGFSVNENITVKDEEDEMVYALKELWQHNDIVISTGGLGPTDDDITKNAIARFFGKKLIFKEEISDIVKNRFKKLNKPAPDCNKSQAEVPEGFDWLPNNYGTAPGLYFFSGNKTFVALPGVPIEMQHLLVEEVMPRLKQNYKTQKIFISELHTIEKSESEIAEILQNTLIPSGVNLAFLPQTGRVTLRIYGNSKENCLKLIEEIEKLIGNYIWGRDEDTLPGRLHSVLINYKLTVSVAESCTGGLIQSMLSSLPGASAYFKGGITVYSNEMKEKLLNVSSAVLDKCGAVSKKTAYEMCNGLQSLMKTDLAGAVTGIAGPDGGTEEKPVGTVHICVKYMNNILHKKFLFSGNREMIRLKSAERMLLMYLKILEKSLKENTLDIIK